MSYHTFKTSIQQMIGYRSGRTFDAMMQAAGSTTKLIMREKQCKLLGDIKRSGIGTNDVEHAVRKLPLSDSAKQKLRIKIMTAKIKDAHQVQHKQRAENFRVWRMCRKRIPGYLLQGYLHLWKNYTSQFRTSVSKRHAQKLSHLKTKWQKKVICPDEIRGISLIPDMNVLPPEFSLEPRLNGGLELDEDEKLVLELPVKFGLDKKLNLTQCKIDTEEALQNCSSKSSCLN